MLLGIIPTSIVFSQGCEDRSLNSGFGVSGFEFRI